MLAVVESSTKSAGSGIRIFKKPVLDLGWNDGYALALYSFNPLRGLVYTEAEFSTESTLAEPTQAPQQNADRDREMGIWC